MGYVYQEYPACRYNGREVKTVNSEAEDKALGPGWFDSPEKAKQTVVLPIEETEPEAPKVYTVRELNQMKKLGVYAVADKILTGNPEKGTLLPDDPDAITKKSLISLVLKAQEG